MAIVILRIWQISYAWQLSRTRNKWTPPLQQEMLGKSLQSLRPQRKSAKFKNMLWRQRANMSITLCPEHLNSIKQFKAILGHFLKGKSRDQAPKIKVLRK